MQELDQEEILNKSKEWFEANLNNRYYNDVQTFIMGNLIKNYPSSYLTDLKLIEKITIMGNDYWKVNNPWLKAMGLCDKL